MPAPWPRVILHADMDAFYAAVEQLDDPRLRGRPLLVGGTGPRSVVATASYEARRFGVGSAMPMATARRRCPQAVVVPPRMERYKEVSRQVMGAFRAFTPLIEPLSLDEAFLDLGEQAPAFPSPEALGQALKDAVRAATGGLTVSVGVASTKYVAKVASDFRKPDGLTVVHPTAAVAFLAPLPVARLWGAGPKTVERLHGLGLTTIGEVAAADRASLAAALGQAGHHFHRLAHADDPREVVTEHEPKSLSWERTLDEDITGAAAIRPYLRAAADEVAERLRRRRLRAWGVRVKLKTADFRLLTRQLRLAAPTDEAAALHAAGLALLAQFEMADPVRLVGLGGYELIDAEAPVQLALPLAPAPAAEE